MIHLFRLTLSLRQIMRNFSLYVLIILGLAICFAFLIVSNIIHETIQVHYSQFTRSEDYYAFFLDGTSAEFTSDDQPVFDQALSFDYSDFLYLSSLLPTENDLKFYIRINSTLFGPNLEDEVKNLVVILAADPVFASKYQFDGAVPAFFFFGTEVLATLLRYSSQPLNGDFPFRYDKRAQSFDFFGRQINRDAIVDISGSSDSPDRPLLVFANNEYHSNPWNDVIFASLDVDGMAIERQLEESGYRFAKSLSIGNTAFYENSDTNALFLEYLNRKYADQYRYRFIQPVTVYQPRIDEAMFYVRLLRIFGILSIAIMVANTANTFSALFLTRQPEIKLKLCLGASLLGISIEWLFELMIVIAAGFVLCAGLLIIVSPVVVEQLDVRLSVNYWDILMLVPAISLPVLLTITGPILAIDRMRPGK